MAGRIPQSFINDLLTRIDIVDVVDARVSLRKTGRNFQALCPFHDEKTASFSVNPEKQFYYCFGCGATGTALTFLMEHDRRFVAAVETLASIAGSKFRAGASAPQGATEQMLKVLERQTSIFARCCAATPRHRGSSST
jgi:DNA primase